MDVLRILWECIKPERFSVMSVFKIKINVLGRVVLETLDGFCCYLLLESMDGKPGDLVVLTEEQVRGLVKIEVLNDPD